MFSALVHGMGRLLAYFFEVIPNYGVGIILLTLTVRVAMIPLAVKQAHLMVGQRANAEKIRKLQPELKKLKEKYRDDRAKQYELQKKLYAEHNINMLSSVSGCLPMLLQMPIFMAMYQVLSGCNKIIGAGRKCAPGFFVPVSSALHQAIVSSEATFLTMNLNFKPSEVLKSGGVGQAWPYYLLSVFMGVTMWYQTKQMAAAQPSDPQIAQTQKIMQFMPLILVFASVSFPVGLTLYWSATNIWTIGQQFVLLKKFGPGADNKAGVVTSDQKVVAAPKASSNGKPVVEVEPKTNGAPKLARTTPPGNNKRKGSGKRNKKRKKSGRR